MVLRIGLLSLLLAACASVARSTEPAEVSSILVVDDRPEAAIIRLTNSSNTRVVIYYNYDKHFNGLQMFEVRFRDRGGSILKVSETEDGWFTPKQYAGTFQPAPLRRIVIAPQGSTDLPRNVGEIASWVRWEGRSAPPCEIQLKLTGFLRKDRTRPIEILGKWGPGPCPRDAP